MNRQEIRERSRELYADELQYALARDEEVNTEKVRDRATLRLTNEVADEEVYELCRGLIEMASQVVDRRYVVDLGEAQLVFGGAIRIADNTLVPVEKARLRDWMAFDEIREQAWQRHAEKRDRERAVIAEIIEKLSTQGEDARTVDACRDMFGQREAA